MGGLTSSSRDTVQNSQQNTQNSGSNSAQTNPWSVQAPFLQQGFNAASNAYGNTQVTPEQLSAFAQMLQTGTNQAVPNSSAQAGGALTTSGANATGQGLYGLAGYNPTNTPQAALAAANQYANNPQLQGMIDSATMDARRAVNEGALPQIERNAQASGNVNSNRTGIAQGIVNRGLADTVANTSANIRGTAYSQGLQGALQQLAGNDTNRLGALTALTGGGVGAANAGVNANTGSVGQQGGLYNIANAGIQGQQAAPFAGLQNFWNIVGGQNYGNQTQGNFNTNGIQVGNTNQTQTSNPSLISSLSQILGMGSSLFGAA